MQDFGSDRELFVDVVADAETLGELAVLLLEIAELLPFPLRLEDGVVSYTHGSEVFLQKQLRLDLEQSFTGHDLRVQSGADEIRRRISEAIDHLQARVLP